MADALKNKPTYEELEAQIAELKNQHVMECELIEQKYKKKLDQKDHDFKKKIIENEELFHSAFENSNIGVCFVDSNANFQKVNLEMTKILGYSKEELEQMNVKDITVAEDIEISSNFIRNALENENNARGTFHKKYLHKLGHIVYCRISFSLVKDKSGVNQYFISYIQDVSQLKEKSDLLDSERMQLLELLDDIPEPIYVCDYDTSEILYANIAKRKIFGEDILEKKCHSIFHNFDSACSFCIKEKLSFIKNKVLRWEQYYPAVNKYFYNVDKLILWKNNRRAKFQISFDITDLKNAENQIRKLSVAVEQNPATIVITDTKGNIEYANPRFTQLTGYSAQEVVGNNTRILNSGKTDPHIFNDLWKTLSSGNIWKGEFINVKKNGEEFIESATISPIFDNNRQVVNYIAIKEDVTEKKQLENILRQSEKKLRELNATKDKFLSIIAHDLKNPFNAILGFSGLLVKNIQKYDKARILKFVETIKISSQQASELLENLLAWARAQSGNIEFNPRVVNLNELVISSVNLNISQATKKNIEIIAILDNEYKSFCDPNMINTVIRNLLTNAIKFTNNGGTVTIEIKPNQDKYIISIKDTGIGIDVQNIDKLFKIESKHNTLGTADETGTGLGLLLCKEFVEKNNGEIWLESELGKGSVFMFTLPIVN